jgi:hypothetical protein
MKLDFSVLSQSVFKSGGQVGHEGQPGLMRATMSPELSPVTANERDLLSRSGSDQPGPTLSPVCPSGTETGNPSVYAVVPPIPQRPLQQEMAPQNGSRSTLNHVQDVGASAKIRVRSLPQCPHCGSYYLYRRNNIGRFQCLSCERRDIPEEASGRVQ